MLEDAAEPAAQLCQLHLIHSGFPQPYPAAVRRVDALEQLEKCGLAGAVAADNGGGFPSGDGKAQIVKHRLLGNIPEADPVQYDILLRLALWQVVPVLQIPPAPPGERPRTA